MLNTKYMVQVFDWCMKYNIDVELSHQYIFQNWAHHVLTFRYGDKLSKMYVTSDLDNKEYLAEKIKRIAFDLIVEPLKLED